MHTLEKQTELYILLHANGYLTHFDDVNEMTEEEILKMIEEN